MMSRVQSYIRGLGIVPKGGFSYRYRYSYVLCAQQTRGSLQDYIFLIYQFMGFSQAISRIC